MRIILLSLIILISLSVQNDGQASSRPEQNEYKVTYWESFKERATGLKSQVVDFWSPVLADAGDKAGQVFLDKIHPKVMDGYDWYVDAFGYQISEYFWRTYDDIAPKISSQINYTFEYYEKNNPITYYYFMDVPAWVKKAYEKSMHELWNQFNSYSEKELTVHAGERTSSLLLAGSSVKALKENKDGPERRHLNKLLDSIRMHSRDKGMEDCYNVIYVELDILNAMNIGCNIFVTSEMYKTYKNNEGVLTAVLAHEMSHGELGHGVKILGKMAQAAGKHVGKTAFSLYRWTLTGDKEEYLDSILKSGHMDTFLPTFLDNTTFAEFEADFHAVGILEKAGHSNEFYAQAIIDLHEMAGKDLECQEEMEKSNGQRSYPSLCLRLEVIRNGLGSL